jgi:hypothetical protein
MTHLEDVVDDKTIRDNIDFILSHFGRQHELFPRTIQTSKYGGQVKIEYESDVNVSKRKMFEYFKESGFKDCKINGFPYDTEYTRVDFDVKNKTAATFIMIDLDLMGSEKKDKERLDMHLQKTLDNLSKGFHNEAHPTVLWTGNGYHVYQPINGIIFEQHEVFYKFLAYVDKDLTTEFLRFAKDFFSDGKADSRHLPSIKSCLVRVPGSINSKNGAQVRIVQEWDGKKPAIQWVTDDFRDYLIQKRIDEIEKKEKEMKLKKAATSYNKLDTQKIEWIENLIHTPIEDYRKYCLWAILIPYLVNIRKESNEESIIILKEWLQKCDQLRQLNFNPSITIKNNLRYVRKYKPISRKNLRKEQTEIYHNLRSKNIILD